jgi:L-asparagine transporter-like permease
VIATGGHMIAVAVYMHYWFPGVPGAWWIVGASAGLGWLNARDVGTLGAFEYWFAMIKVVALVAFVVLGAAALAGFIGGAPVGLRHYTDTGGFVPNGIAGIWLGVAFVIYSFIGVEIVAVTSGEAADPRRTIPAAIRRMVGGLCVVYVSTVAVLVAVMPWTQAGVGESPFVTVLRAAGLPAAAGIMNVVVLSAALSSANANLYIMTRTLFSLARAGYVPGAFGALTRRGAPLNAILASSLGLLMAVVLQTVWPDSAYVWFFGVALFGGLFVWLMVFVTHLAFRRHRDRPLAEPLPVRVPLARARSALGAALILSLLVTTWWAPGLRITLLAGIPWLGLLWIGYVLTRGSAARTAQASLSDRAG